MSNLLTHISSHLGQSLLQRKRKMHPLSRSALLNSIYGQKYAQIRDQTFDVMIQNPDVFKHPDTQDSDFKEERKSAAIMTLLMHKLRPIQKDYMKDIHQISIATHASYNFDPGFSVKSDISFFLYAKSVYSFASQNPIQQEFVKKAITFEHIGCFGLTELGHGSNVRGILTQAVYDSQKKQFIIHSPCKDAMKFWIGAAAQLATKSVIWAQLIVDGQSYGPHPFIVPIRDQKTHELLKGCIVGDCGHKNGNNIIDNAFMMFDHVRIPKDYALDRISGVDKDGKFVSILQNPEKRFGLYMGPLSVGRAFVAINSVTVSTSALAIAIRYSNTRKQFSRDQKSEEQYLINYPLTKLRLMPLLAQNLVYFYGGAELLYTYNKNMSHLLDTKNKLIQELHSITSPCKAKSSWFVNKAVGECRQMCGGHGYSAYSGLNRIYHGQDINTSWEGDNNMLLQQTTKYILKIYRKLTKGKKLDHNQLQFLTESIDLPQNPTKSDLQSFEFLQNVLKTRIQDYTQECIAYMMEMNQQEQKVDPMDIWNEAQPYFGNNLSSTFGDLYYLRTNRDKMNQMEDKTWKQIIEKCIKLWMYNLLYEQKWGTVQLRKMLEEMIRELCDWLEPRSISIIDCLAAPSQIIGSPFSDENGEGMKKYMNLIFTGKNTFRRVPWHNKLVNKFKN